ncbi:MAG: hypothetical protein ACKOEM_17990, partial [Planctomycetia bacterium]
GGNLEMKLPRRGQKAEFPAMPLPPHAFPAPRRHKVNRRIPYFAFRINPNMNLSWKRPHAPKKETGFHVRKEFSLAGARPKSAKSSKQNSNQPGNESKMRQNAELTRILASSFTDYKS